MRADLIHGDCLGVMKAMADDSIDAIVCDPPYGLGFMNREWDHGVPGPAYWAEALRVAKPGAYLLAFGGTRMFHRLMVAIEDAGWELRDTISGENVVLRWCYGSGFPKNLDVSKAVDAEMFKRWLAANPDQAARRKKLLRWAGTKKRPQKKRWVKIIERGFRRLSGTERKIVGVKRGIAGENLNDIVRNREVRTFDDDGGRGMGAYGVGAKQVPAEVAVTRPGTPEGEAADGMGTALKPSWEPIVVARKPFRGNVAQVFLEHGTGGINVGACRIGESERQLRIAHDRGLDRGTYEGGAATQGGSVAAGLTSEGRWPANLMLCHMPECEDEKCISDCPVRGLDEQSGTTRSSGGRIGNAGGGAVENLPTGEYTAGDPGFGDSGGVSRFFYTAKASKSEREAGLHGRESRNVNDGRKTSINNPYQRGDTQRKNTHPTVKPVSVMRWLVRLVAKKGQTVLDPFCGSGTTGIGCKFEDVNFIGIDIDAEHIEIGRKRIAQASIGAGHATAEDADEVGGVVQLGLFGA